MQNFIFIFASFLSFTLAAKDAKPFIHGTWVSGCLPAVMAGMKQSVILDTDKQDIKITREVFSSQTSGCDAPLLKSTISGKVKIGEENYLEDSHRYFDIDKTWNKATVTILSPFYADHLNQIGGNGECGIKNWKAFEERKVPFDCLFLPTDGESTNSTDYDHLEFVMHEKLLFKTIYLARSQEQRDGSSPDKRKETPDIKWAYSKVLDSKQP